MNFNKMTKINQDSTIINPKIIAKYICFIFKCFSTGSYFFAVADGHGVNGHLVSAFLKKNLTSNKNCIEFIRKSIFGDEGFKLEHGRFTFSSQKGFLIDEQRIVFI
jgi:serine/threonine protein phosphatase PrpC